MKYIRTPKPKREKSHIPFRLNLLFFFAFLLLALLVGQLAYLQIQNGGHFAAEVNRTDQATVTGAVPRGLVFDSQGRALVTNKANSAITFTKNVGATPQQMSTVADRLAKLITVDTSGLHDRDYADYYLAEGKNSQAVLKHLPPKYSTNKISNSKVYNAQVAYVQKHLPTFTPEQHKAAALYKSMNGASQLTTVYLKNTGVSEHEVAVVGEHLNQMPGVNLGTDWERAYPFGNSMTSIIGTVSSEKAGLPSDGLSGYLANGYARNDRVGTSYLEKEYENVLKGSKSRTQVEIGSNNQIVNQIQQFKGEQGANLNLTIDSTFQQQVEAALKKNFGAALSAGDATDADGAYAVAMDPNTGALLAIAGQAHNTQKNTTSDDALGVINRSFTMGSAVKGAMVLGALQDGVISVNNNTQAEDPIYLPSTPVKKSVYPIGTFSTMTAPMALQVSSNIYMMHLAMKEAHAQYVPHVSMTMNNNIFAKMRRYFAEFGLGQTTGVDLPGEVAGLPGSTMLNGKLAVGSALDLSYGNYDNYTVMQLAQYISTIANNGYRMKPYIVGSISKTLSNGQNGPTISTTAPQVQLKVPNTQAQINLVKQGMWLAVHGTNGWTTATPLQSLNPGVAVKTGTAQSFTRDRNNKLIETTTESIVGFAPANNPKIAIAIVMPNLKAGTEVEYANQAAKTIFSDYYKLHAVKKQPGYTAHQSTINGGN